VRLWAGAVHPRGQRLFSCIPHGPLRLEHKMMISIVAEMIRLSALTGNCGRLISRFLERNFLKMETGSKLVVKSGALAVSNLLEMAVFAAFCKDDARVGEQMLDNPGMNLEVVPHLQPFEVSMTVLVDRIPEGVKERQKLLKIASDMMHAMVMTHCCIQSRSDMDGLLSRFLGDLVFKRTDVSFQIFENLVKGSYDDIGSCDRRLVCLAALLNPEVAARVPDGYNLDVEWYGPDEVQDIEDDHALSKETETAL